MKNGLLPSGIDGLWVYPELESLPSDDLLNGEPIFPDPEEHIIALSTTTVKPKSTVSSVAEKRAVRNKTIFS